MTERTTSLPQPPMEDLTPLMKQYWELKAQVPDTLLLFRMGDFYELFGEDAVAAAKILEITLTTRDKNKANPVPMAGVPHHSVQGYIQRLLKSGKKVAISEQLEEADSSGPPGKTAQTKPSQKSAPKIVRREIVRILTPAVQFDAEGAETRYLATLTPTADRKFVLACLEPSTGETLISNPLSVTSLSTEIRRLPIRHFLQLESTPNDTLAALSDAVLLEKLPPNYLSLERATELLKRHYEMENLRTFISSEAGLLALGMLVLYTLRTQQQDRLAHLRIPEPLQKPKSMVLGPNSAQHLDLEDLFQLINHTQSTLGSRQLRRWLTAPLRDSSEILERQKAVQELTLRWSELGQKLHSELSKIYDLERICGRVNTLLANPRDTLALGQSLTALAQMLPSLGKCESSPLAVLQREMEHLLSALKPLSARITQTQFEEAPLTSKDGGIFKTGTTPELDHLISLTQEGHRWLIDLEVRERETTGIPSLKVRYNRVFGYYIEVTQAHLKNVPSHYQRKQTMVGAERFFTEELKKFEEEILTASVKQKALEQELFNQLVSDIQANTASIMGLARLVGDLDALLSLAAMARSPGWVFPRIDESLQLEIRAGRHPLVDHGGKSGFVPNDIYLSPETRLTLLITGPNMGGKSTVMRQTALIVILGQMGAPVPAREAKWGVVSSLFTRIGAQDAIARGQSTFMVEMSELAHILHCADERSLIVLDEIGRGTSTYDGMSVAWATLEWICNRIQARTLFATHYHELIRLSNHLPRLANAHMAVESSKDSSSAPGARPQTHIQAMGTLRFLYELREGPTNESFGIHVAQLAGLPKPVVNRAWKILSELESTEGKLFSSDPTRTQLSLFELPKNEPEIRVESLEVVAATPSPPEPHPVEKELTGVDINAMTPIQALNFLVKLQELLPKAASE